MIMFAVCVVHVKAAVMFIDAFFNQVPKRPPLENPHLIDDLRLRSLHIDRLLDLR